MGTNQQRTADYDAPPRAARSDPWRLVTECCGSPTWAVRNYESTAFGSERRQRYVCRNMCCEHNSEPTPLVDQKTGEKHTPATNEIQ